MFWVRELIPIPFIPRRIDRIGNERHRMQGGGRRVEHEHWIQHGLARIDVHMDLCSKAGTMGWDWDLDEPWLLPTDWYIPEVVGERMTVEYTGLGQLVVVREMGPLG